MSNLLIIHNNGLVHPFKDDILHQFNDWHIEYFNGSQLNQKSFFTNILEKEIHFLLFGDEFDQYIIDTLSRVSKRFPLLTIIYYSSQMKNEEFARLYKAGIDYCIVGDARQINLIKTLQQLWAEHWRRIPPNLLPAERSSLPREAQRILYEIETKPLKKLSAGKFAEKYNVPEGQFRSDFKNLFGQSFRDFKQNLIHHYETLLLLKKGLKPSQVYDILNYKNVSAFSRSFKTRHGKTWQQLIRQTTYVKNIEGKI